MRCGTRKVTFSVYLMGFPDECGRTDLPFEATPGYVGCIPIEATHTSNLDSPWLGFKGEENFIRKFQISTMPDRFVRNRWDNVLS